MYTLKPIQDPLGHEIQLPENIPGVNESQYKQVIATIKKPSYLIIGKNRKLYFFRFVETGSNMMIEARSLNGGFMVIACLLNPTAEYIIALLKKGEFRSF